MYQDSPVASAMKLSESKSKGADSKAAANTVFVDPVVKNIDRIWDVSGDGMLFGRLSKGKEDAI
jgi:hypothetical protein